MNSIDGGTGAYCKSALHISDGWCKDIFVPVDQIRLNLESTSVYWFTWVRYSGYAVAFGCALEAPETYKTLRRWALLRFRADDRSEDESDRKSWIVPLAAIGLLMIVIGIVVETFAEGKVSDTDALLRTHESEQITRAEAVATTATRDAGTARQSATVADEAASLAKADAASAGKLAASAQKEANAYAYQIADAKGQAAEAVSRLAAAEQRLTESTRQLTESTARELATEAKLRAIRTPRYIPKLGVFAYALSDFRGTTYRLNVFADAESISFAQIVAKMLDKAGWKRDQPVSFQVGIPVININFDAGKVEGVPTCLDPGVGVHVYSDKSLEQLRASSLASLPNDLQAAAALVRFLPSAIEPVDEHNVGSGIVDPNLSRDAPLTICVGKKP